MIKNIHTKQLIAATGILALSSQLMASNATWYVKPYVGLSQMSDLTSDFTDIDSLSGDARINLDNGFTGGIGIGYRYNKQFSAEFGWEYRSNESKVVLDESSEFDSGNYASNIFYLNGQYHLNRSEQWQPYLGAGLTWVEEVDIDLERNGNELSYSGAGEVGYQIFAGVDYQLNDKWTIQSELRYGSITNIDLKGEAGDSGRFNEIDYETTTLQLGLMYKF